MSVLGEERSDRASLDNLTPLFETRPGEMFVHLERIVMLKDDDALLARKCSIHFITKPDHLLVAQTNGAILIRVQTNEAIIANGEGFVGRAEPRLIRVTTWIVMSIMVAYQCVERHLQFARDVF